MAAGREHGTVGRRWGGERVVQGLEQSIRRVSTIVRACGMWQVDRANRMLSSLKRQFRVQHLPLPRAPFAPSLTMRLLAISPPGHSTCLPARSPARPAKSQSAWHFVCRCRCRPQFTMLFVCSRSSPFYHVCCALPPATVPAPATAPAPATSTFLSWFVVRGTF